MLVVSSANDIPMAMTLGAAFLRNRLVWAKTLAPLVRGHCLDGVPGDDRGLGLAAEREDWDPSRGGMAFLERDEWDPSRGGSGVADREEWDASRGGSAPLDRDEWDPSRLFLPLGLLWPESSSSESRDSLGMVPLVVRVVTIVLDALRRGVQ